MNVVPNCLVCRGACCEDLVFPSKGLTPPTKAFLEVRCGGVVTLRGEDEGFVVDARCSKLGADGLCTIYDDRPLICAVYVAGGDACKETLLRRRTPEQRRKIWE